MLLVLHWAACWYFPHIKFTVYSTNVSSAEFVTYFPSTIITQWQKILGARAVDWDSFDNLYEYYQFSELLPPLPQQKT